MLQHADDSTFEQVVLRQQGAVLVEFFTVSCGPCKQLEPHLLRLAKQTPRLTIVKVDSERSPNVAAHFGVRMAPTLVMFVDGQFRAAIQGAPPPNRLRSFVAPFV